MDKINQIARNQRYIDELSKIEAFEKERIFCRHDMTHFLDVARIAYIRNFELELKYDKALIYGFALLHDIGRGCEYETGEPHDVAGARIATEILKMTDYHPYEIKIIVNAIADHRSDYWENKHEFTILMYKADKASRACYLCNARAECKWPDAKKNLKIEI